MHRHSHYADQSTTLSYPRQDADMIAEDKAALAAADGKWEAFAQSNLSTTEQQRLGEIATESQTQLEDEFYRTFVK